jgi:tetratricopeptide (TPR) repeat protein
MKLASAARSARTCAMRRMLIAVLCMIPALAYAQAPTAERRAMLDRLLGALQAAPSEQEAAPLEEKIRQMWLTAGTPAVTLLMSRGVRELKADANTDAIDDFSAAITLDPSVAEAYHQRAIARFSAGDAPGAVADIQAALQHEPRDFAALQTLSAIAEARKDWKGAYGAWQKVMELDPKTPGGEERLKDLKRRALGEEA